MTQTFPEMYLKISISIHTPARGVTASAGATSSLNVDFNPHSRKGSDIATQKLVVNRDDISIHTPARGVTEVDNLKKDSEKFQSTLPQGE